MNNSEKYNSKGILKKYIASKRKLSRTNPENKKYNLLEIQTLELKRQYYISIIDEIKDNWNNYSSCPARKCYRAMKGLVKTLDELGNTTHFYTHQN